MFFVGTYPLTIDAKGRLSVPFVVRDKMTREEDGKYFYVLPGRRRGTLMLFPDKYFERTRLHRYPADKVTDSTYAYQQFEYSQSALLEPDSQSRISIPERLLKRAGIDREATLIGVQDHLELWDRETYEQFEEQQWQDYEQVRPQAIDELYAAGAFANARPAAGEPVSAPVGADSES
jgi:MraZ protein